MVSQECTLPVNLVQPPKSGYGFLSAILDGLDDQPLLDALQQYRRTGRKGHPLRAMWRAYIAKFLLKIRFNNQLLERLRGSRKLRDACGFGDEVPSESVLSRFVGRLADHQDLVEQCLVSVTEQVRDLVPAVKQREGRQDQPLPPLGAVLAVDSTLFETYSNPNRKVVSDPDARWGLKHSAKTKEGKQEWGFGYKMHLISDATHGLPLAFTITPANESDSTELPAVLRKTLAAYPWLEPAACWLTGAMTASPITSSWSAWTSSRSFTYGSPLRTMGCTTASTRRRESRPAWGNSRWITSTPTRRLGRTCSGVRLAVAR